MSTTAKKKLPHKPEIRHTTTRKPKEHVTPLVALLDRIAERGKSIPLEERDAIWEELKAKEYCAGSGPKANQD